MKKMDNERINGEKLQRNLKKMLVLGFCQVFLVIMPILVPFFESRGLNLKEIFFLQALFAGVVLLMEVPSGYLADVLGRKRTILLGSVFLASGHSLLLVAQDFQTLALFEALLGIGVSLISGSDLALLYDTEAALEADQVGHYRGRQQKVVRWLFMVHTGSEAIASIVCSVLLLIWSMQAAVYVQVIASWIPLLIALTLVEPPGERLNTDSHAANFALILKALLYEGAVLRYCFLALCLWSLTTFYAVWLLQKVWQQQGIDLYLFGYLWGGLMLISAVTGKYAQVVERRIGSGALLAIAGIAPVLGYAGLSGLGLLGGLLASLTFFVARGFGLVVLREALNSRVPGRFRATANSLASFGFRGAFAVTGPFVGYALELWGMQTTLILLAILSAGLFMALILPLILAIRENQRHDEDESDASNSVPSARIGPVERAAIADSTVNPD